MKTADFLDQFASLCEDRFVEVEGKLNRMEAVLSLLETKLDSVPDLKLGNIENIKKSPTKDTTENPLPTPMETEETDAVIQESPAKPAEALKETDNQSTIEPIQPSQQEQTGVKAKDDYRYKKYFKMVHFGVQPTAVKLKMQSEGVDPDLLDNPDQILPDGILDPPMLENDSSDEDSN